MKKFKVISKCPVCKGDLVVKELECETCKTKIEGAFTLSKFDYLTDEQLYFVEVFIKNKGSIKSVEKDLNVSYPTVKKLLDEAIISLGYQPDDEVEEAETGETKSDILEQINKGLINVEEAVERIRKIGGKK